MQDLTPVLVKGLVTETSPGTSVGGGVDENGEPIPEIPHTDLSVQIDRVLRGKKLGNRGEHIVVVLTGGESRDGNYVLDGVPDLDVGNVSSFFLERGDDAKYYPLAGGAAIATKDDKRAGASFRLSPEVTGIDSLELSEEAVATDARE